VPKSQKRIRSHWGCCWCTSNWRHRGVWVCNSKQY